eukprot:tig00000734_g3764.t1
MALASAHPRPLTLLGRDSLVTCLPAGFHLLQLDPRFESGQVGLLHPGAGSLSVRTRGLKWELDPSRPLQFGQLLSVSNELTGTSVEVETPGPVLWTSRLGPLPEGLPLSPEH